MYAQGNPPPYWGPQQGPQMVQLQPMPGQNVIPNVVPIMAQQPLGTFPALTVCKSCQYQVVTKTEAKPTTRTHLWALCLCVLGCWPFFWMPYCMPSCNNVTHYCPNCNAYLGNY